MTAGQPSAGNLARVTFRTSRQVQLERSFRAELRLGLETIRRGEPAPIGPSSQLDKASGTGSPLHPPLDLGAGWGKRPCCRYT